MTTTTTTTKDGEEFCSTATTTTTTISRCWEDEIPTEIMAKILSMVPIRRLLQYKCVSKTWFYTISHHIDPNLFSVNQEPGFIVIQRPGLDVFTKLSFNLKGVVKPESIDDDESTVPLELILSNSCTYQSSCNGLICLKHYNSKRCRSGYRIIVCNPYLLEATTLPDIINSPSSSSAAKQPSHVQMMMMMPPSSNFEDENYGLGFSPPTNQYKVVRLTWFARDSTDMIYRLSFRKNKSDGSITSYHHYRRPEEIKILTLGGGTTTTTTNVCEDNKYYSSSWRDVSSVPPHPIHGTPVYANGFLYWLVDRRNSKVDYNVRDRIVSFNVEKEKFYITSQPPSTGQGIHLINLRGCLAMVHTRAGGINVDVWVLRHLNNNNNNNNNYQQQQQQQWIREYSLELSYYWNRVIGLWEHSEILCFVYPNTLISYDPKTNKKRRIHVRSGLESTRVLFELTGGQNEIYGHIGSLVSLKAYGCKTWRTTLGKTHSNLYDRDALKLSKLGRLGGVSTTMHNALLRKRRL